MIYKSDHPPIDYFSRRQAGNAFFYHMTITYSFKQSFTKKAVQTPKLGRGPDPPDEDHVGRRSILCAEIVSSEEQLMSFSASVDAPSVSQWMTT